jgi:Uncharacterized protein conserved in bacteria (DUF2171)
MELEASLIQQGWHVYSSDGERIGTVTGVAEDHLEVELEVLAGSMLAVPFDHVEAADDGEVELDVPAGEVGQMGWGAPPGDRT